MLTRQKNEAFRLKAFQVGSARSSNEAMWYLLVVMVLQDTLTIYVET